MIHRTTARAFGVALSIAAIVGFMSPLAAEAAVEGAITARASGISAVSNDPRQLASSIIAPASAPTLSQAKNYVTLLYGDYLHRAPTSDEATNWAIQLANGAPRASVSSGFVDSDEYRLIRIDAAYSTILGRAAEPGGRSTWLDAMHRGTLTTDDIEKSLYASDEYYQKNGGTDLTYAAALYQSLLHRTGAAGDYAFWAGLVSQHGRAWVIDQFWTAKETISARISLMYTGYLRRAPDAGGLATWVGIALQLGDSGLRSALTCSDEYFTLAQSGAGGNVVATSNPSQPAQGSTGTASGTPAPTPTPSASANPTVAAPAKGVGAWYFPGVEQALPDSGAGWYYTWVPRDQWVSVPKGMEYVPMIWGAKNVNDADLAAAKASGTSLLGFNEPDDAYQSNMTVAEALDAWPKLEATGLSLGSPATAYNAELAGSWLDQFMTGARERGYRVDFIAVHWYRWDGSVDSSVKSLKAFLTAVHDRYGLPVWLTEFAAFDFSRTAYADASTQAAFLSAAGTMMQSLPFVKRYAWFAMPTWSQAPSSALYTDNAAITQVGKAFKALP